MAMLDLRLSKSDGGGGTGGDVTIVQGTGSSTVSVMSQRAVSSRVLYSNENPVPTTIGGVTKGTVFTEKPITEVLDMLLQPYQQPKFTSFTLDGGGAATFEIGYAVPSGNKTFTWAISNEDNLLENSIILNGETGVANTGSRVQNTETIRKDKMATHDFTISAKSSTNEVLNSSIRYTWLGKGYWGVNSNNVVTDDDIKAMDSELVASNKRTVKYDGAGGKYAYYAYPAELGELAKVTVGSFEITDYTLETRNIINSNGVSVAMLVYRINNLFNGELTVIWG